MSTCLILQPNAGMPFCLELGPWLPSGGQRWTRRLPRVPLWSMNVPGILYNDSASMKVEGRGCCGSWIRKGRTRGPQHEACREVRVSVPRDSGHVRPLPRLQGRCGG